MASVMARAEVATGETGRQREATPSCLTTTLYDLITAIQAVVNPEDDALVVATVVHLVRSGRLTWRGQASGRPGLSRCTALGAMPCVASLTIKETSWSPGPREECTP